MQQKFFKGTAKLIAGLSFILIIAAVYSCNDDKKTEATTVDSSKVVKTTDSTKMNSMKDSITIDSNKTDQAPPPPRN